MLATYGSSITTRFLSFCSIAMPDQLAEPLSNTTRYFPSLSLWPSTANLLWFAP